MMTKYINIIRISGALHACPKVYDTYDEAKKNLDTFVPGTGTEFVCNPVPVEIDEA